MFRRSLSWLALTSIVGALFLSVPISIFAEDASASSLLASTDSTEDTASSVQFSDTDSMGSSATIGDTSTSVTSSDASSSATNIDSGSSSVSSSFSSIEASSSHTEPSLETESKTRTVPIYRLYNKRNGEHLYTSSLREKEVLYGAGWGYEGIAWYAPSEGKKVYRLYNAGLLHHLYTTDENEVRILTSSHGWTQDSVSFYSGGDIPVYRLYNEGLKGLHHWTTDANEYAVLPRHGWTQERVSFYAQTLGSPLPKTQYISPKASLAIEQIDTKEGAFTVRLSNIVAPSDFKSVKIAVWGDKNGQNDLRWYTATRQTDGTYTIAVTATNHQFETGTYHLHAYLELSDGTFPNVATKQFKVQRTAPSVRTVFLDPGHGGRDSGAYYGGVKESTLNIMVANRVKDKLEAAGYKVIMSRYDDTFVDFVTQRSAMANKSQADIFISIHFNATGVGVTSRSGIETYWYQPLQAYPSKINQAMHDHPVRLARSHHLAKAVHGHLIRETGAADRLIRRESFAVLRETSKPAILLELGYMDNPHELMKIQTPAYQEKLAQGIFNGINQYYIDTP